MAEHAILEPTVLIVGAGPAGACLAQILRGKGIPFRIFERETELHETKGGGFALDSALPHLTELLPNDMGDWWTTSVNYPNYDNLIQIDAIAKEVNGSQLGLVSGQISGTHPSSIIVCRQRFRSWMMQKLPVERGKQLEYYHEDTQGVTVYFKDGSSARGSMLIGADGSSSAVRRQMLGGRSKASLHPFVPICGSFEIRGEPLKRLRALASGGIVTVSPNAQNMISPLELRANATEARYWWITAFRSQDAQEETEWVQSADKNELHNKAMEAVKGMPEFVIDTMRFAGPASVWKPQIRFSEYIAPAELPRGRVTLLGDAAHNTTPYGGMGANTGIADAADLGRTLLSWKWETLEEIQDVLQQYNSVMLPRGRAVVVSSGAVGLDKSFGEGSDNPNILPWHKSIRWYNPGIPLVDFKKNPFTAA